MAQPDKHPVTGHVSPYRRIEIGARPSQVLEVVQDETASAKSLREAAEAAQRIEHQRIWNHVIQTAQGCNPTKPGEER
jgi:hypothetical protein